MEISVYMETLAYKYGGAEAYTASLIEALQTLYKDASVTLITEHLKKSRIKTAGQIVEMLNKAYGTSIKNENFAVSYFDFKKIDENLSKSSLSRKIKIVEKEIYANKRAKNIKTLSQKSDLFINASFKIVSGGAKKNVCVVHFPYLPCVNSGINQRIALFKKLAKRRDFDYRNSYDLYLPNSNFTSKYLKVYWEIPSEKTEVLYPPVRLVNAKSKKKHGQILVCSRISREKKIDSLARAFSKSEFLTKNANLVIAGSLIGEEEKFADELKKILPNVEFVFDPDRKQLEKLYSESEIFWHAKGLDESDPFKAEHFGITTVEAMSAGCIPVVIDKGGQKEIVCEDCGFKWRTLDECVERTEWIFKNPEKAEKLRENSVKRSRLFSVEQFKAGLKQNLEKVTREMTNA